MLKWSKLLAVWLAPVAIVALVIEIGSLVRVPVPAKEQSECLKAAKEAHEASADCGPYETIFERGLRDPVAYYTLWLTLFTGALAYVGIVQGYLIWQQIRLARAEFVSTNRPRIVVRHMEIGDSDLPTDQPVSVNFVCHNIGDSAAIIGMIYFRAFIFPPGRPLPPRLAFRSEYPCKVRLECGQRDLFEMADQKMIPTIEQVIEITQGASLLYCIGLIQYVDDSDSRREAGFCYLYRPEFETWEPRAATEYHYSY